MKNGISRFGAFLALFVYLGNVLFAADYAQSLMAGQRTLDLYLERAKIQTSQERFEDLARQGLNASLCEWEQSALDLKTASLEDWFFQRERLREALSERADGVFNEWFLEQRKSQVQEIQKSALYSELKKLAQEFFYTDQDGNKSRIVSKENILEAKAQYKEEAREIIKKHTEGLSGQSVEREAYYVESQALNELTNQLLYDHDSLKRMSDSQAAMFIADKLSSQIENESERSIERLFNSLQDQPDFVDQKDLQAKMEAEKNWLGRFEKELELGLKKWSDAEEEFLSARSDWEKEAENIYVNDNKKWQEAYDELQNRKIAWSKKIEEQIQAGRSEWRQKLESLDKEIEQSLRDFQNALLWESEHKRQVVQSQEESYAQSRAILEIAQKGVELWYERWGEKYNGLYSYWKSEDNPIGKKFDLSLVSTSYLKNQIYSWKESLANSLNDCYKKIEQKKYDEYMDALSHWIDEQYKASQSPGGHSSQSAWTGEGYDYTGSYQYWSCSKDDSVEALCAACRKILKDRRYAPGVAEEYWDCLSDASDLLSVSQELFEWLDLYDAFSQRAKSALYALYSDSCANIKIVDELSSEKAKASWLVDYWTKRVQISKAALDYAQNDFSDLEWAFQTEKNLADALDAYKLAQENYQIAINKAEEKSLDLLEERDKYYEALEDSQKLLERIDQEREVYDQIYQERLDLLERIEKDPSLELLFDLDSLNYDSEDFKRFLYHYCLEEEESYQENLSEQIELLRTAIETAYEDVDGDSAEKEAILLLVDGSGEEIHAFFDGNSDFEGIFQDYKAYSRAILAEEALAAKSAAQERILLGPGKSLEEYFSDLDQAAKGASGFTAAAVKLYKELLLCQQDCASLEKKLAQKISSCSQWLGKINFSPINWFCQECEDFLLQETAPLESLGYDRENFKRLSFGRKGLLEEIFSRLDFLLGSAKEMENVDLKMTRQGGAVQAVQREYEKSLDGISSGKPDSKINRYIAACNVYNSFLEEAQKAYDKLEQARRDYRLAQEIFFYAQNEYLHDSYDPAEMLKSSQEALAKAQAALDALNAIEQERADPLADAYKTECMNYYKGRIMLFEYESRVADQTEKLFEAQERLRAAEQRLVCESVPQGDQASLSDFAKASLVVSVDQENNYSFSLNKSFDAPAGQNQSLLTQYLSDYSVLQTDVYQNNYYSTKAKVDALDFLEELKSKPYGLVDLYFCVLQIKSEAKQGQKGDWFNSGEDPTVNDNFKIGDLSDSIHGVDVSKLYYNERMKIIKEAYDRVISLGGEEDIAKFILYSEQTLSKNLDLDKAFRNAFIAAAMEKPLKRVRSEESTNDQNAKIFFSMAAVFSFICALPFGIGAWAAPQAALYLGLSIACQALANQFRAYADDMEAVRDGCKINLEERLSNYQKLEANWLKAKQQEKEEREKLNVLVSGKKVLDQGKITWENFNNSLAEAFDLGTLGVNSSYFMTIRDSQSSQKGLKDFFEELSSKEDFCDIRSVMQRMSGILAENYLDKKESLENFVAMREGDLTFDKASYYQDLLSFYSKDLIRSIPAKMNRPAEDYMAEAFSLYNSLAEEAVAYSNKNRFDQQKNMGLFIYADFDEQRALWEDKNKIILDTAQEEWLSAKEKINLSFNSWQKQFALNYENSSKEWERNYKDFLDQKEDWLFRQYMSESWQPKASYSTVQSLKSAFDEDGKSESYVDSICDPQKFSRLADLTKSLVSAAQNESYSQFFFEKMDASLIKDCDMALKAQRELQKNLQESAAKASAQQCQAFLEKRVRDSLDGIKEKNKYVENWELEMVREAGYSVDSLIHRNAIIDVSVLNISRKRQEVHRYEYFTAAAPKYDLDASAYSGSSEFYIMKKVEEAQKKIQDWSEEIFGSPSSQKSGGRLDEHIGRAPVFKQNVDPTESRESNVMDFGSGQIGKILLDFQWNSIVSAAAASEFEKPIYCQKLMNVDGFNFPSIRDIVGVVFDIVSSFPAFYALRYVDDVVFGILDVGLGYKSFAEVASDFAKQGLLSGVSKAVSALGNAAGNFLKNSSGFFNGGAGSQVLKGMQNAAGGYLNNVASNYVEAFDFASGKMDWDRAASSWLDAGAIANAAGSFLGQSLGAFNNLDANGLALNSNVFGNIQSMNSTIGALAGQGLNYLATGDFKVNVLSVGGVGLLELGISDGDFTAAFGKGGADLSLQSLAAFGKGVNDAAKVSSLKSGSQEERALLNASNLLAMSGGKDNVQLASDLFNQKRRLLFEDGADSSKFGRTLDDAIILDQALLSQGKEGQAMIAAMASLQNLKGLDKEAAIDAIDFSKLEKPDGSAYTEEEIKKAKDKLKSDAALSSMAQVSSALSRASQALGFDLENVQDKNSLAALASAYKQNGMAGVYAIYADAQEQAKAGGSEKKLGLAQLLEQPWFQNVEENRGVLLGQSLSMEEYNKLAKENAVDRYVARELKNYCKKNGDSVTEAGIKEFEKAARAKAESEIVEGVANEKYGYEPETYNTDLKNYGCTLATAAYIAYSITGNVGTLAQANEILKDQDLFVYGTDNNGVTQKNCLTHGDSYVNAVNAIAGGDYLQKDGKDFSVDADIAKGGKLVDNRQSIFDRLVKSSRDESEVYFTHMRVNGSHSVLFDSMAYTDEKNYKSSTLSVMDPWQGGGYGPKSWRDISRADFYKLTQSGKEIYELTRIELRQSA